MSPPPVRYVTTRDGYDIAYGVSGDGTPFVVGLTTLNHVQLAWQYPGLGAWLEAIASRFQLIQLDPRGTGLSKRGLPPETTADDYLLDIEAVVDQLRLDRFMLCGVGPGASIAVRYALKHPDRVLGLVLSTPVIELTSVRAPDLYASVARQDWDIFLNSLVPRGRSPAEAKLQVAILKESWRQEDLLTQMRITAEAPVRDLLGDLRVPVLILQSKDYLLAQVDAGMTAARLAHASFVLIDGADAFGDAAQSLQAIESFAATLPSLATPAPGTDGLSPREVEVLLLLAAGKSNQQIADALVISRNTVRRHVSNIFDKTGVSNRTEASNYARDHRLR
jgi:DNA-binding CsgD family transcriptional regulator/pimeloyl-ACP methyl ester carboxylesterase